MTARRKSMWKILFDYVNVNGSELNNETYEFVEDILCKDPSLISTRTGEKLEYSDVFICWLINNKLIANLAKDNNISVTSTNVLLQKGLLSSCLINRPSLFSHLTKAYVDIINQISDSLSNLHYADIQENEIVLQICFGNLKNNEKDTEQFEELKFTAINLSLKAAEDLMQILLHILMYAQEIGFDAFNCLFTTSFPTVLNALKECGFNNKLSCLKYCDSYFTKIQFINADIELIIVDIFFSLSCIWEMIPLWQNLQHIYVKDVNGLAEISSSIVNKLFNLINGQSLTIYALDITELSAHVLQTLLSILEVMKNCKNSETLSSLLKAYVTIIFYFQIKFREHFTIQLETFKLLQQKAIEYPTLLRLITGGFIQTKVDIDINVFNFNYLQNQFLKHIKQGNQTFEELIYLHGILTCFLFLQQNSKLIEHNMINSKFTTINCDTSLFTKYITGTFKLESTTVEMTFIPMFINLATFFLKIDFIRNSLRSTDINRLVDYIGNPLKQHKRTFHHNENYLDLKEKLLQTSLSALYSLNKNELGQSADNLQKTINQFLSWLFSLENPNITENLKNTKLILCHQLPHFVIENLCSKDIVVSILLKNLNTNLFPWLLKSASCVPNTQQSFDENRYDYNSGTLFDYELDYFDCDHINKIINNEINLTFDITTLPIVVKQTIYRSLLNDKQIAIFINYIEKSDMKSKEFLENVQAVLNAPYLNSLSIHMMVKKYMSEKNFLLELLRLLLKLISNNFHLEKSHTKKLTQLNLLKFINCCSYAYKDDGEMIFYFFKMSMLFVSHPQSFVAYEAITIITEMCQSQHLQPMQLWNWYKQESLEQAVKLSMYSYITKGVRLINSLKYFTKMLGFSCVQELICKYYRLLLTLLMPYCVKEHKVKGLIVGISKTTRKPIKILLKTSFLRIYTHVYTNNNVQGKECIDMIIRITSLKLNDLLNVNIKQTVSEFLVNFYRNPDFVKKTFQNVYSKEISLLDKGSRNGFASFIADRFLGIITYFESCLADRNIEKPIKESVLCSLSEIIRFVGPEHVTKYRFKIIAMLEFVASLDDTRLQMICLKIWNIFLHVVNIQELGPSLGHIVATLQQLLPSNEREVNNIYKFLILENTTLFNKYLPELYFLQDIENIIQKIKETIRLRVDRALKNKNDIIEMLKFFYQQISSTNVQIRINGLNFLQDYISKHRIEFNQLLLHVIIVDPVLEKLTDLLVTCCRHEDSKLQLAAAKCLGEIGAIDPSYLPSTFSYEKSNPITLGIHTDDFTIMALNELCRAYQFQKGTKYVDNFSLAIQETLSASGISPSENKKMHIWESMTLNMRQIMTPFLTSCYTPSRRDYECPLHPIFNISTCQNFTDWAFAWSTRLIDFVRAKDTKDLLNSYKPSIRRDNEILTSFFPYILIHALQDCNDNEMQMIFEEFNTVFMACQQINNTQTNYDEKILKEFFMPKHVNTIQQQQQQQQDCSNKKLNNHLYENVVNKCSKLCSELLDFLQRWLHEWERVHDVIKSKEKNSNIFERIQKFLEKFNKLIISKANFNTNEYARSLIYLEEHIAAEDTKNRLEIQISFLMQIYYELDEVDAVEGAINVKTTNLTLSEQIMFNRMLDRPHEAINCYEQLMSLDLEQMGQDNIKGMINCYLNMETPETALLVADGLWQNFAEQYTDEYFKECKLELFWRLGRYKELKDLLEDNLIRCNIGNWSVQCAQTFLLFREPSLITNWFNELDKIRENVVYTMKNSFTSKHLFSYPYSYDEIVKLHLITEVEKARILFSKFFINKNNIDIVDWHKDCLNEMRKFIDDWELRLSIIQPIARVIGPILSYRRNLLMEAKNFINQSNENITIENNNLKELNNLINTEIGNLWLRSAQMYRDASNLQQAHISLMRAEQYEPKILFLEKAKLLWKMNEQRSAFKVIEENLKNLDIKCNRNYKALDTDDRCLYAEAKFLQAKYSAESMNVCADLNLKYFKDAIILNKNSEKCHVHLAQYMEKIYNSYSMEQKKAEIGRKVILEIMLSYVKSLRCGNENVYQSLPRLLTLWLDYTTEFSGGANNNATTENRTLGAVRGSTTSSTSSSSTTSSTQVPNSEELSRKMNDLIRNCINFLPTSIFYTSFSQMLSRICHPSEDVFNVLRAIIVKITKEYPHQSLWNLLPIFKSFNTNRVKRCKLILTDSRLADASFQKLLIDFNMLTERLIELTNKEVTPDNNYDLNVLVKQLPKLFEDPNFTQILLPFEKFMQISFPITPTLYTNEILKQQQTSSTPTSNSHPTNPFPHKQVFICGIKNEITVLRSAAKPKKITIRCDDGEEYDVMVKPKDDLRRDFRLMEFNDLVKRYLHLDFMARNRRLRIRTYAVVPFNEECGLVEWLPKLNSFRNICTTIYRKRNLGMADRVLRQYVVPKVETIENKRRIFLEHLLPSHPPVFHEWFRQRFPTPHMWYEARTSYIKTLAVMSIVGYILGLGDRHGENILFDETNGDAVHVDFNCLFNQGELFAYPELVPFRLTQNMTFAMGPLKIEGLYRKTCEITLRVLKHASTTLMSVLRPFVYDVCVYNRNINKQSRGMELTDPKAMMDVQRIDERLQGFIKKTSITTMPLSVEGQVNLLIDEATNIDNLASMYIGWGAYL